jgi:hypothetical protein
MDFSEQLQTIAQLSHEGAFEAARHVSVELGKNSLVARSFSDFERELIDRPMRNLRKIEQLSRLFLALETLTPSHHEVVERAVKVVGRKQPVLTPNDLSMHLPSLLMLVGQAIAERCKVMDEIRIEETNGELVIRLRVGPPFPLDRELAGILPVSALHPVRLLHLSDLHFTEYTLVEAQLQALIDDIRLGDGLKFDKLDYVVISGDFTNKGEIAGLEKAHRFLSGLTNEFGLAAEHCILVPGNHDVVDTLDAYTRRKNTAGLRDGEWIQQGSIILAPDAEKYPLRLQPFSDELFNKFLQRPYPTDYRIQGLAIPFWQAGLQFLALNSCWQIDEFHRKRASINPEALANVLREAKQKELVASQNGLLTPDIKLLRIAVWHHSVAGPEQMKNTEFLGHLQNNGVKLALHGDIHELRRDLIGYWQGPKQLHIVGAGSFGANASERPESTPRLYNVLEIHRNSNYAVVHTRYQPKPDGPWKPWNEWPREDGSTGGLPYYKIHWAD